MRCRRRDIEVWRSGDVLRVQGRVGVCLESSGDALQALPLCLKRSEALEACCACSDAEAQRFDALQLDILVWRSGALEARCRRCPKRGMEL